VSRRAAALLAGVALAVLAAAVVVLRPGAAVDKRPNVLIVMWDTVRADRMSLYGHTRDTTPFVDRFAKDAVVYDHAIASSEWTGPTHATLFTGLPLRTHGMDTYYKWLDHHHETLAERLGAAGYKTWAFTGNRFVSDFVNMLQGFDTQLHTYQGPLKQASRKATARKLLPRDRSTEISPAYAGGKQGWSKRLTLFKDAAPVANRAFGRFLDQRDPEQPFFAFINLMEAHQPRVPSLESRKALLDDAMIELALQTDSSLFSLMAYMSGKHAFTSDELEAMAGTYDAAILDLDRSFQELIEGMERKGVLDDTIVVLVADHGEMLGEKGLYSHRWALYEPLVHVPLVIRYPDAMVRNDPRLRPRRVSETLSISQVPSTLLEAVGVDPMPGIAPSLLDGPAEGPVFTELRDPNIVMAVVRQAFPDVPKDQFARSLHAIYEGPHKLIRASDHQHELYDLDRDPTESDNLVDIDTALRDRLLERLADWERATPAYDPAARGPKDKGSRRADPETRRMLEALGYTDDEEAGDD
jgi:arylsulfatase A-like enzyme